MSLNWTRIQCTMYTDNDTHIFVLISKYNSPKFDDKLIFIMYSKTIKYRIPQTTAATEFIAYQLVNK